jgi:hypothetical protein
MLDRTVKCTMTPSRDQSTSLTGGSARDLAQGSESRDVRAQLNAFDDSELCSWLMECIVDGSEHFLCAFAEAAVAANAGDYILIRPALLALRRKYNAKHAK